MLRSHGMSRAKGKNVGGIIKKLDPQKKQLAKKLRAIVKKTLPDAVETVKWGNITYLMNDKNLAWLLFYRDHADFGFFMGAKLKSKLLEGTGKGLRHIKVRTEADINKSEFARLLKEAARLTR